MADVDINGVATLLDHYKAFAGRRRTETVRDFQNRFIRLRDDYQSKKVAAQEKARQYAPSFNVFRLLGVERDEQRTHSALLADLLAPDGSHGQQYAFLSHFLEHCQAKFSTSTFSVSDVEETEWVVRTEYHTPYGRPDILVRNADLGLQYVIENKIYAPEHGDQLSRYARWQATQEEQYPQQALIYLTLGGQRANSHKGADYFRLSYREDVVKWLESALVGVAAARVKETIRQYLDLIRALSKGTA